MGNETKDLSHWDFAETFTAYQAACLIIGIEPNEESLAPNHPVIGSMEKHYQLGYFHLVKRINKTKPALAVFEECPNALISHDMKCMFEVWQIEEHEINTFALWRKSKEGIFDRQIFTRQELARWLKAIGMKSVYQFERQTKGDIEQDAPKKQSPELLPREKNTLMRIIAVLVELATTPRGGRTSEAALIDEMLNNYSDKAGISKSTLQQKFAAAKRILQSD